MFGIVSGAGVRDRACHGGRPSTSVTVTKYAADNTTVLAQVVKDYTWLEANLTVYGDGTTHYYQQGPIFEGDMWDTAETENLKDKGAVRGTALRDLCGLVGGMSPGDEIMVKAADGWHTERRRQNGLSGKWISEVAIFSGEAPVTPGDKPAPDVAAADNNRSLPVTIILDVAGTIIVIGSLILLLRKRSS
jgi:hypothetical protein